MVLVEHPAIVVTVPAYNEAAHLRDTLGSLRAQTFADFAVLVGDNASDDATGEIAREFAATDPRFHYHRHSHNIGALHNFRFLRNATRSPLFMWLGGHDMLAPTFLESHVAAMLADPTVSLSYSFIRLVDRTGVPMQALGDRGASMLPADPILRYIQAIRYVYGHQVNHVIRREAIADFVFESVVIWDLVLLSHIAFKGRFRCVPEPLYSFRDMHPQFSESSDSIMERITGTASPMADQRETIAYYLADFDRLAPASPLKPLYRWMLRSLVIHRVMPEQGGLGPSLVKAAMHAKRRLLAVRKSLARAG